MFRNKFKKYRIFVIVGVILIILIGLAVYLSVSNYQNSKKIMPGSDRDEHGCIGSAGYSWCEVKNKCLRTWEEPCN